MSWTIREDLKGKIRYHQPDRNHYGVAYEFFVSLRVEVPLGRLYDRGGEWLAIRETAAGDEERKEFPCRARATEWLVDRAKEEGRCTT